MTHPAFRDKGSNLYLPCGTRDRVCKSGTVPDISGRLAAMAIAPVVRNPDVYFLSAFTMEHMQAQNSGTFSGYLVDSIAAIMENFLTHREMSLTGPRGGG